MTRMILVPIVVVLTAACGRTAPPPRFVEGKAVPKAGQMLVLSLDKGDVHVEASKTGELTWKVKFKADQGPSLIRLGSGPSQKDLDACTASWDSQKGFVVTTADGVGVEITVAVPEKESLQADLKAGILNIAARTGKTDARIGAGILEFDSSALPKDACVTASMNSGVVRNKRDIRCAVPAAILHGDSGVLTVN
jgi:hypothetical protein